MAMKHKGGESGQAKNGPTFEYESAWKAKGCRIIAGVDEAGRGPLAGGVVAAAVCFADGAVIPPGLDDSKKLTERNRELLFEELVSNDGVSYGIGIASAEEIDRINILKATHLAMARAVEALPVKVDVCLIDGLPVRGFAWEQESIVKGDGKSLSIAAASILAKVTRDRLMMELDREFPQYGFARHKGYGTREHLEALRAHGPCPQHRKSFGPVSQLELPLF